jgi:plasmid stabilization system protein ParE
MALGVRWSLPAEQSVDAILSHIAAEDPLAARALYFRLMEAIERASCFPEMARFVPELGTAYRELLSVRPFRVIYRIAKDELWIVAALRMEQDFDPGGILDRQ